MQLNKIKQTGFACPSQWDAEDEFSNPVYIRYRYDNFSVRVNGVVVYQETIGQQEINGQDGAPDGFGGVMPEWKMLEIVTKIDNSINDDHPQFIN